MRLVLKIAAGVALAIVVLGAIGTAIAYGVIRYERSKDAPSP